jgi:tRNA dimethylallyltransferase
VRGLLDGGYSPALKSMQSLGYRHMCEYLAGNTSLAEAVDLLKRDTRHFARRQLIWFRGDNRVQWVFMDGKSYEEVANEIAEQFLIPA